MTAPDAFTAAALLAIDPAGLGGAVLRGSPGPARDAWLSAFQNALGEGRALRRMPVTIDDDRLLGGLDLAATLSRKKRVIQKGLLSECDGGALIIPSAERLDAALAARIAGAMRRGGVSLERDGAAQWLDARFGVIAFDEGAGEEERIPTSLSEGCAFLIDLGSVAPQVGTSRASGVTVEEVESVSEAFVRVLVSTAAAYGVASLAVVRLAMRTAVAAAARDGRHVVTRDDIVLAAQLVLAPRATQMPSSDDDQPPAEPPHDDASGEEHENDPDKRTSPGQLDDVVREAVQAVLPPGLLAALQAGKAPRGQSPRAAASGGRLRKSLLRGRPLGSRAGSLRPGARLALVDTLRAAAPWQTIRKRTIDGEDSTLRIEVRRSDFRMRRFAERREATIVFAVDASGSAAFHRLAEAKGAIELLLAEAYVARTHAALVVFRGTAADAILPPTRSLARARALLADLPGGGGTPLAQGLDAALSMTLAERARGRDPMIVVLTDGSANIARDGTPSRSRAAADGIDAAQRIAAGDIPAVFIDTSPRPRREGRDLAEAMKARFVALPYLDARAVSDAVRAAAG